MAHASRTSTCGHDDGRGPPRTAIIVAIMDAVAELEQGREAYSKEAWSEACESLSRADGESPLAARRA